MATELQERTSNLQTLCKLEIKSGIIVHKISSLTTEFFITHSRNIDNSDWSNLMDKLIDIVNAERN